MKDLHRIQDEIINKLNEAMDKDEKEAIYNELSENVLELINREVWGQEEGRHKRDQRGICKDVHPRGAGEKTRGRKPAVS